MARNEELERRCQNWARWREGAGGGGLGYGGGGWRVESGSGGYRTATVPTSDVEAEQTNRAIEALQSSLRRTVEVYYLGTGTMEERCQQLQISRATIYVRIDRAHEDMSAWLRELEAKAKHERERVELLTRRQR